MVGLFSPAAGGSVIYDTSSLGGFFLNFGDDTMFITVTGVADTHNGTAALINCTYDGGINCNPGTSASSGFPGWIVWQRAGSTADLHDNSVVARWCVTGLDSTVPHNVQIRLGVNPAGGANLTFLEAAHFIIDSETMGGSPYACTAGS
jgi:hypothetical protein